MKLKQKLEILVLLLMVVAVVWFARCNYAALTTQDNELLSPTQIESIKAIGQWEFLTISDEEIVDTVRKGFFDDDELVRIYKGTLRLGIDMADVEKDWIKVIGDTVRLQLPPMKLLDDDILDEANTRSLYETGTWDQKAREALAQRARQKMIDRCMTRANMRAAEQSATIHFHQMLRSMGIKNIQILPYKP